MNRAPVAISITTHNRLVELQRTLEQVRRLKPAAAEVWVCADGCSDGTEAFVRTQFPDCALIIHQPGRGSVESRDKILRSAKTPYVLSLDDDSYPVEESFLADAVSYMEANPGIGVMYFPQRSDEFPESLEGDFAGPILSIGSFANSGALIRRAAYLATSGYPGFFFHAYEEPDFALQCMAAGFEVVSYPGLSIRHHFTTHGRNEIRTHQRHARNEAWSIIMRCPLPWIPLFLIYRALRQFMYACRRGWSWVLCEPQWWLAGVRGAAVAWRSRNPVRGGVYRRWVALQGRPQLYPGGPHGNA